MIAVGIIPARYQSARFPGKPLADIIGKSMINRVYQQALRSELLSRVIVATDDERIYEHCISHSMEVMMTSDRHRSGTDRVAEVAATLDADIIVNIQGDEPFLPPEQIDQLIQSLQVKGASIGTLVTSVSDSQMVQSRDNVKVVKRSDGRALYFSRSVIPFARNQTDGLAYFQHLGVYAYRKSTLTELTKLPPGNLEKIESLEQLRWLEAGHDIHLSEVSHGTIGIDTPEDLQEVVEWMKKNDIQ